MGAPHILALIVLGTCLSQGIAYKTPSLQCFICNNCPNVEAFTNHIVCNETSALPMKKPPRDYFETIHRPTLMTVPFTTENAIVEKGVEAAITNGPIVPAGDLEDGASIQVAKVSKRSVNVEQKFSCFRMQARSGKDLIVKRGCLYTDSKAEVFGEWAAVHGNNKHVHFSACDKSFCNGTGCGLFLSVPLIIAIIGGWSFNFIKL